MIDVTILNPEKTLYHGQVERICLPGDCGDFEVMAFHKPLVSLLRRGRIVLDEKRVFDIRKGIVRVLNDELVALVEA